MGFLSGVLGAVKDDEAVKTYDKYITEDNKKLKSVLDTLTKKIGSGRDGLAASVGAVREWLEGYETQITNKTNAVINPLKQLKDQITREKNKIDDEKVSSLSTQVDNWTGRAEQYKLLVGQAKNEMKHLDSELSGKLKCNISLLVQATGTFKEAAENDDLREIHKMANDKMDEVCEYVGKRFEKRSEYMQNYLDIKIGKLYTRVECMRKTELKNLISYVDTNLAGDFSKVDGMMRALAERYKADVVESVKSILSHALAIQSLVVNEKKTLKKQVVALGAQIAALKSVEEEVKNQVPKKLENFEHDKRDGWYLQHVDLFKKEVKTQLKTYVMTKLGKQISKELKELTDKIAHPEVGHNGHLDAFVNALGSYADGFKSKFETAIGNLVDQLLKDGDAEGKIRGHVIMRGALGSGPKIIGVKNAIKTQIIKLSDSVMNKPASGKADVQQTLKSIQQYIQQYSEQIQMKIDNPVSLIQAVEKDEEFLQLKPKVVLTASDQGLQSGLKSVLATVKKAIEDAHEEVKRFITTSQIKELEEAITAVTSLPDDVSNKVYNSLTAPSTLGTLGETINNALGENVNSADEYLGTLLHDAIEGGIGRFQAKIESNILKQLNTIKSEFEKLQTKIGDESVTSTEARNGESDLHKEVNRLQSDINMFLNIKVGEDVNVGGSVHKDLAELKSMISALGTKVTEVVTHVDKVRIELTNCINQTGRLLTSAIKTSNAVFKQLQNEVGIKIKESFQELQARGEDLYTNRKIKEVAALQSIVNAQIDELNLLIEKDKELGVKGYLNRLNKIFMPPLNDFTQPASRPQLPEKKLLDFSPKVKDSFKNCFDDLQQQLDLFPTTMRVNAISNALSTLLAPLTRYDHAFTKNLAKLKSEIDDIAQQTYANNAQKVSLSLVQGLSAFVKELEKVYVRVYDGHSDRIDFDNLVKKTGQIVDLNGPARWITVSTPDGTKLAKILLTIFNFIYEDIIRLINKCEDNWGSKKLCLIQDDADNPLGLFLQRCGYTVAKSDTSKDGETQCKTSVRGETILRKLNEEISNVQITSHLTTCESNLTQEGEKKKTDNFNFADLLDCLLNHIDRYNEVCHYSTHFAKRQPCSAYEMLIWLSGLPYSVARPALLQDGIGNLLDNANKKVLADVDGISLLDHESSYLDANPTKITWYGINEALELLCSASYDVLVSIAGTGDADTIYGSDLCNNSFKFKYPASGEDCLDMLLDILRRLFPPLRFLQTQCSVGASHNGWLQCTYGRDVQPATWPCKEHPTDKSKCQPTCQPNCQVNTQPNCQPKSPLMSYLSDCHVGCLPHKLTSIGCKYEC
ncbi:hypothetical protein, conserved, partial [Babesia bigemina]